MAEFRWQSAILKPDAPVLKLRLWGFQPQRGDVKPAQGNALGWWFIGKLKP